MGKRAGRKRKSVRRQPNGQPYRESPKLTVIEARQRHYGLSREDADSQLAGYVIGRMCLNGDFGPDYQHVLDTTADYCAIVADYSRIKHPGLPIPKAMDYLAGRGMSLREEPSLKLVERIERRYEEAIQALAHATGDDRMYFHYIAFHDLSCGRNPVEAVENCVRALQRR